MHTSDVHPVHTLLRLPLPPPPSHLSNQNSLGTERSTPLNELFAEYLLTPTNWFALWRLNSLLAAYHAHATGIDTRRQYCMEDKVRMRAGRWKGRVGGVHVRGIVQRSSSPLVGVVGVRASVRWWWGELVAIKHKNSRPLPAMQSLLLPLAATVGPPQPSPHNVPHTGGPRHFLTCTNTPAFSHMFPPPEPVPTTPPHPTQPPCACRACS